MQFRMTQQGDIDRVMDILSSGRLALAAIGIDQWQGGYPHREVIEDDVANETSYLVCDGDNIIATAMVGFAGERDYDVIENGAWLTSSLSSSPNYATIHRVAVDGVCQGRGAASLLLENAERITAEGGCGSVRIDTHPGNFPMRNLLLKRGYVECGTIYISHAEGATPDRIAYERLV